MKTTKNNSLTQNLLYLILLVGIVPATWLLFLTCLLGLFLLENAVWSLDFILVVVSMILRIFGYVGFLSLFEGLHKTNHVKKIALLLGGIIGFILFMIQVSPRNMTDWLLDTSMEAQLGKLPITVSGLFLVLTIIDFTKNKTT